MKSKMFLYSNLTVIFFILSIASIGGISSGMPLFQVFINISLFSLLTFNCANKEAALRNKYHKKLKRRVATTTQSLQVYSTDKRKYVA